MTTVHKNMVGLVSSILFFGSAYAWADATSRTIQLNNGERIRHLYEDGIPVLASNDHIAVELAGYQLGEDEGNLTWRWSFTLALKHMPPVAIVVSDVTTPPAQVIVHTTQGYFTGKRWFGRGDKFLPNPENLPWLFQSGTTQRVFRFDLALANGNHKILYQPAVYTTKVKEKILKLIKTGLEKSN